MAICSKRLQRRPIPQPIIDALQEQLPNLLQGEIEGDEVYVLMGNDKGEPHEAVRYIASPEFLMAVRVYDSGVENLKMLCGEAGFNMRLLAPSRMRRFRQRSEFTFSQ